MQRIGSRVRYIVPEPACVSLFGRPLSARLEHAENSGDRQCHDVIGCSSNQPAFGTTPSGKHGVHPAFEYKCPNHDDRDDQQELCGHPRVAEHTPLCTETQQHPCKQCSKAEWNTEYESKHLEYLI